MQYIIVRGSHRGIDAVIAASADFDAAKVTAWQYAVSEFGEAAELSDPEQHSPQEVLLFEDGGRYIAVEAVESID